MADADDVAGADEEMGLAEGDAALDQLGGPGDDEQRITILLELRPLMRMFGILDRQIVQLELRLNPSSSSRSARAARSRRRGRPCAAHSPASSIGMSATRRPAE